MINNIYRYYCTMNNLHALMKGVGSILDIFGTSIRPLSSKSDHAAESGYATDLKKLSADWRKVGDDIRRADKKYVERK